MNLVVMGKVCRSCRARFMETAHGFCWRCQDEIDVLEGMLADADPQAAEAMPKWQPPAEKPSRVTAWLRAAWRGVTESETLRAVTPWVHGVLFGMLLGVVVLQLCLGIAEWVKEGR